MGFSQLVLLGAIAGFTIYLGLPAGRLGPVDERVRVALPMFSVGMLAFIFMDVTKHGQEIVDATLVSFKDHRTSLLHVLGLFALLAAAFTTGAIGLATVLIIGFALHNATEGFGIVGPLGGVRPSWAWLGLAGLVGGGPTVLGTIVGYQVHSDPLELCFYALAGGAILYVVGEIWSAVRRYGHRTLGLYLLAAGFIAGVATDLIVSYGGA